MLIKVSGRIFGNKGYMGYGIVVVEGHKLLWHNSALIKQKGGSEDYAVYKAVVESMSWAIEQKISSIEIAIDHPKAFKTLLNLKKNNLYFSENKLIRKELNSISRLSTLVDVFYKYTTIKNNKMANALALKVIGMPIAYIYEDGRIEYWQTKEISLMKRGLPDPQKTLKFILHDLNQRKNFNETDLNRLAYIKKDQYDTFGIAKLKHFILLRYGEKDSCFIEKILASAHEGYRLSAYRWIARGLNPNAAFKKAAIEMKTFGTKKSI